jgi:hypothetical protein
MVMRRSTTTPSTGDRIVVYPTLTVAYSTSALARTSALADAQRGLGRLEVGPGDVVLLGGDDGVPTSLGLLGPLRFAFDLGELGPGLLDIDLGLGDVATPGPRGIRNRALSSQASTVS